MWIKSDKGFYVCELRGVCFVTWVTEKDRANAAHFPDLEIYNWIELIEKLTGENLNCVQPY